MMETISKGKTRMKKAMSPGNFDADHHQPHQACALPVALHQGGGHAQRFHYASIFQNADPPGKVTQQVKHNHQDDSDQDRDEGQANSGDQAGDQGGFHAVQRCGDDPPADQSEHDEQHQ